MAVAEPNGEVRSLGRFPTGKSRFASWLRSLARRADELTAVWVPDEAHEALRDLVRAREAAKQDQLRARHRLSKFLLRHGKRFPDGGKAWTLKYMAWVRQVHFRQAAQEYTMLDYLHEVEHMNGRRVAAGAGH